MKYSSSNKKVATVNSKGMVTLKGSGKAVITVSATENRVKAVKKISITVKPSRIASISLSGKKKAMTVSWAKASGSTGYELQYSTSKRFTAKTTVTVAVFGIYMSGSRTTFLLLSGILFLYIIRIRKVRKIILPLALLLLILVAILGITGITGNLLGRLFDISLGSSTLLGRLLYAQDALKLIVRHPFGCGYYGYYFLQTEVQTGVYSVANVHNELLQMMLDIGMIPALLFYGMMLVTICKKSAPVRNRLAVLVLLLHSLLDYDFQFLSVCFVLILFLDLRNVKEYPVSILTRVISATGFIAAASGAVCIGLSDFLMMEGQYEKAVQVYNGNTLAKTYLLTELEEIEELNKLAILITENNQHVPLAYHAMAQSALAKGKVPDYIKYKERAIELAPYDFDAYTGYLDALSYCFRLYMENGEKESANTCLQKAEAVPELLEQLKKRTSWLGWHIDDTPRVTLPGEYQEMIEEMQMEYRKLPE